MAQGGSASQGQNRGHPSPLVARGKVANRVYAPVYAMQSTRSPTFEDRIVAQTALVQLAD